VKDHIVSELRQFGDKLKNGLGLGEKRASVDSLLERLDDDAVSKESEFDKDELLSLVQNYVKLEANKSAAVTTMSKLIKISKEKNCCFLCKKKLDSKTANRMEEAFKPDTLNCDSKIKEVREKIETKINQV
jgi:hypothetical protein